MALTIHSVAALAKLFSEEIEHIDPGPVEAVTATGANLLQTISHAVVPQIVPSFLAYTLLRWDINMRMATVVGCRRRWHRPWWWKRYAWVVTNGSTILWAVAVVIIIVDYVSANGVKPSRASPKEEITKAGWGCASAFYVILGNRFIYFWNLEISLRVY
jgi:phosphonate transport system permease protein